MTVFVKAHTFWENIIHDLLPKFSKIVTTPDFDDRTFMKIQAFLFPLIYYLSYSAPVY